MKAKTLLTFSLVSILIFLSWIYIFQVGGDKNSLISNLLYLLPPLLASIGGIYLTSIYGVKNPHGRTFLFLSLGILFWFVGELLWIIYLFILNADPFPSVADVFYILGYPLLFLGLYNEIRISKTGFLSINRFTQMLIILIGILLASFVIYFGIYLAVDFSASILENIVKIFYAVGDLILIIPTFFILKMALDYKGGKLFNSWFSIFLGVVSMFVADILFARFTNLYEEIVYPYTLIDLLYILSYLLFAFAFFSIAFSIRQIQIELIEKKK